MLELRNISKKFGKKEILSNFNLTIPEKQILASLDLLVVGRQPCLECWLDLKPLIQVRFFIMENPYLWMNLKSVTC